MTTKKEMKLTEKLAFIQDNYFSEWLKTRREVEDYLSKQHPLFCICGKLATGFHERNCRRFKNKVTAETIKRLEHLIKKESSNAK